jgi:ComF family protein
MFITMNAQTQPLALIARRWYTFALDLLYPPRCGGCGVLGHGLWCDACDALVPRLAPPEQTKPLALSAPWEGSVILVVSATIYATPLREAIHAFKYDGVPDMALPFARLMAEGWRQTGMLVDVIVPVPLHPRRTRERGYNQSELLARHLGELVGVPVDGRVLRRVRHTDQQAHLGAAERKINVRGAFDATCERSSGKHIVLVDDVFTTGATLGECATALLNAGAQGVSAVTLARAA